MSHALLIDFGSTYTKLRAVDLEMARLIGSGQGPSTVGTDITVGMRATLDDLEARLGGLPEFTHRLASSSAAGGLRMVTVGLVPDLTAKAARLAALGAGAKLVGTYAFELTAGDAAAIAAEAPDMVLLTGGTDGGNREVIEANAQALAASGLRCPVVVAGNRNAADAVEAALAKAGLRVLVTDNVMPKHLELNIEPARAAIRQLFIEHIVHAKGIDAAHDFFDEVLMPTPAAVLEAARLLADGADGRAGLGPLMVVDVGGATTDVHTISDGAPSVSGVVYHGLPEPHAKRTVEGDMGMRHTARGVIGEIEPAAFAAAAGLSEDRVEEILGRTELAADWLPESDDERRFDAALARAAVAIAVTRHAGTHETVYAATGPVIMQRGKDLSEVTAIIGTGGALVHGGSAADVLAGALATPETPLSLKPKAAELHLDADYLLFACGLLAGVAPVAAFDLAMRCLKPLTDEEGSAHDAGSDQRTG